jgi:hypothetical protein
MKTPPAVTIARAVLVSAAFLVGLAWAFPWDRLAEYALVEASLKGGTRGVQVSYGSARKTSALPPRVEIRDLVIGSLFGDIKAPSVNLAIRPMALEIESPAATLGMAGTAPLSLGRTQAKFSRSGPLVLLDSLRIDGDLTVSGSGAWSTTEHRLTAADLLVKAPAELHPGLNLLALSTPLKPSGEGQWRLRIP